MSDFTVGNTPKNKDEEELKDPNDCTVVILNDNYTPGAVVVRILCEIFHKNEENAISIMQEAHDNGQAIVGKYAYDIAQTMVRTAASIVKEMGYPLGFELREG